MQQGSDFLDAREYPFGEVLMPKRSQRSSVALGTITEEITRVFSGLGAQCGARLRIELR